MTIHRNVPDFSTNITTESPKIQLAKQRSRIDRYQTKLLTATPMKAIVLKCLEKDPEKRYQNAAKLAEALATLL